MNGYTITPIHLGTITRKKSNMLYGCGDDTLSDFPLIAYYLNGFGHSLLIDTGGSAPDGVKWMPYVQTPEQTLDRALRKIGVEPETIDGVIYTHLHWDHAGGGALLPWAAHYVQRAEYDFISETDRPGYERDLILKSTYVKLDGDCDLLPGISVLLTPGHSVGSQCVIVQTASGPVVLAGDLIPTCENIFGNCLIPNGGNYDAAVTIASMKRIMALGYPVFPGHGLPQGDETH